MDVTTTRFLYFDLGNVLLKFDHSIACRRVAAQTGLSESLVRAAIFESGLQMRYEAGEISSEQFVDGFRSSTGRRIASQDFLASCSDVFELNAPIVPVVAHLKLAGYQLGLISNTCPAHWEFVSRGRYQVLQDLFDVVILSYERRAMKPLPPIYEAAVEASGVQPAEIFFTDDCAENVEGARRVGLDATLFRGVQPLMHELRQRRISTNF
jgi:epoxide hydrolase-like predicted phosphatase